MILKTPSATTPPKNSWRGSDVVLLVCNLYIMSMPDMGVWGVLCLCKIKNLLNLSYELVFKKTFIVKVYYTNLFICHLVNKAIKYVFDVLVLIM